jgi:flagellar hook-associated protein 1 FlgK
MSLFSSINLANNALRANQIALQVVGQNIANANTPGYIREEVLFAPAPTQKFGRVLLGLGVDVVGVVQKVDQFVEQRLRSAVSDRSAAETQEQVFNQLEGLIGELSDTDLSTSLNNFFNGIQDVLEEPSSEGVRKLTILRGQTLANDIRSLASRALNIHTELNNRVTSSVTDINRLLTDVRTLNVRIAQVESGDVSESDAVGLRDQRQQALEKLAGLMDITVSEQASGAVNVIHQGEFLVSGGTVRLLEVAQNVDSRGQSVAALRIAENQTPLNPASGEVAGLIAARDDIITDFLNRLDNFAGALAFEFNKLHSSGQGLTGFQSLSSERAVTSTNATLDAAGLPFEPQNGSFEVLVRNRATGVTQRTRVQVDLNGFDEDTSLEDLRAALDAIDGISASISPTRRLQLTSDSSQQDFSFADDTSGVLAALGVNTFFTGSTALDIGVQAQVLNDSRFFSASKNGIGEDTQMGVEMADFIDRRLSSQQDSTLAGLYDNLVGQTSQAAAVAKASADGFRVFESSVKAQRMSISGVSLDEEVISMMTYQRAYQVSARYIATLNDLMNVLINL